MKKRKKIIIIILIVLLVWTIWSWVPFSEEITLDLPGDSTVRIALLTDLHSCYYGKEQKQLVKMVEKEKPDLVILGGDIFDDRLKDEKAETLCRKLAEKYPCYYVSGNHEYWSGRVDEMKESLREAGVCVLEGDCETVTIGDRTIDICGVDDPTDMTASDWKKQLEQAHKKTDPSHIKILVSHRPEKTDIYEQYDFDLILCGHAHAGQFRIPFVNRGVYAPNQGLFAKYVNGAYTLDNGSTMVVSRGLARESIPAPRFFNHPELVTVVIE